VILKVHIFKINKYNNANYVLLIVKPVNLTMIKQFYVHHVTLTLWQDLSIRMVDVKKLHQ